MKDLGLELGSIAARRALEIYIQRSIEAIPKKPEQIAVISSVIEWLESYRAVLEKEQLDIEEAARALNK